MGLVTNIVITLVVLTVIGIAIWLIIRSVSNKKAGDSCKYDWQCQNKTCGKIGDTYFCCPSGTSEVFDARDYCTGLEAGQLCQTDAMCSNGQCAREGNFESPLVCCRDGTNASLVDGRDYCLPINDGPGYLPDGAGCRANAQCIGGTCKGNAGGTADGICSGDSQPGAACTANADCQNRTCANMFVGVNNSEVQCCPYNTTCTVTDQWCSGLPDGTPCQHDCQCASGQCPSITNTCGLIPIDEQCSVDADCTSGKCGRTYISEGFTPYVCCSGKDNYCTVTDQWCYVNSGDLCQHNCQCPSGSDCVNNKCT